MNMLPNQQHNIFLHSAISTFFFIHSQLFMMFSTSKNVKDFRRQKAPEISSLKKSPKSRTQQMQNQNIQKKHSTIHHRLFRRKKIIIYSQFRFSTRNNENKNKNYYLFFIIYHNPKFIIKSIFIFICFCYFFFFS